METEVESMVTVVIHQASSFVPPLSIPVIDLTPPKPVSPTIQAPIFTATTRTTTATLLLPPLPQQQSSSDPDLASHVSALEQVCANFEKRHKLQEKTIQGLLSRVFDLELRDLPHKIDETVHEAVKKVVQIALQAPLKECFRDLSEAEMKEILHDRMFESGTYQSQPEHVALHEALEASMERLKQPPAPQSSAWKTSDTREAPSSSSKQKSVPHSEQPIDEVPIPDDVNISDLEDTDTAHLLQIKAKPDWLKLVPEEDIPATTEPDWVIPPNDLPEAENNWVDALATSYKDPEENKLLSKTGDMGLFIKWYCKQIGKKKLTKANLEGPTYMTVKPFHTNNISFQFQMEECHRLLSNKIDLMNPEGHRVVPDCSIWYHHWWFKWKEFYIQRHSGSSDRRAVRSHMRILSVTSLKTYERYGYTYLREIILRRADYNEYKISEANFKNLHLNDFEDLYLLHLQGKLNHLPGSGKVHIFNAVNMWTRNIVIRQRVADLQLSIESYQTKLNLTQPS
ncbi:hypothetical protein Tco_1020084 [Tanacetum coccineum]|uniref:Uncharacterized protein n=1 Tax=Tanacetum coccineum TaxID=301880 RepID=A0ABQ5FZ40_9ASTR